MKDLPTAVVVCNGPSLADVPNEWLEKYTTFAANRIHLKEGFIPTYLSVVDMKMVHTPELLDELWPMMMKVDGCFLSSATANRVMDYKPDIARPEHIQVFDWKNLMNPGGSLMAAFSLDPSQVLVSGGTVTYGSMQIAWWKGFRRILCVGLDHNFDDPRGDHFHPDYNKDVGIPYGGNEMEGVGAGKWYWDSERFYAKTNFFYQIARDQFEGEIYNLTPKSKLDVFPVGSIEDW